MVDSPADPKPRSRALLACWHDSNSQSAMKASDVQLLRLNMHGSEFPLKLPLYTSHMRYLPVVPTQFDDFLFLRATHSEFAATHVPDAIEEQVCELLCSACPTNALLQCSTERHITELHREQMHAETQRSLQSGSSFPRSMSSRCSTQGPRTQPCPRAMPTRRRGVCSVSALVHIEII